MRVRAMPLPWQVLPSRHVLFQTMFADAAIGTTLAALDSRMAVAPPTKFAPELKAGLPEELHGLLDWELPMAKEAGTGGAEHRVGGQNAHAKAGKPGPKL